jgi:hypothetical protein
LIPILPARKSTKLFFPFDSSLFFPYSSLISLILRGLLLLFFFRYGFSIKGRRSHENHSMQMLRQNCSGQSPFKESTLLLKARMSAGKKTPFAEPQKVTIIPNG